MGARRVVDGHAHDAHTQLAATSYASTSRALNCIRMSTCTTVHTLRKLKKRYHDFNMDSKRETYQFKKRKQLEWRASELEGKQSGGRAGTSTEAPTATASESDMRRMIEQCSVSKWIGE